MRNAKGIAERRVAGCATGAEHVVYAIPAFGILWGAVFLAEPLSVYTVVGGAVIPGLETALCDDRGINISDKNKQYCEMTALYWAFVAAVGVLVVATQVSAA